MKLTPFYFLKKAASAKDLTTFSEAMINACRVVHIQAIFALEEPFKMFNKLKGKS